MSLEQENEGASSASKDGNIGKMRTLVERFNNHITIAKLLCLALLFSPLWGLWWFRIDPELWAGVGHDFVLYTWIQYLLKSTTAAAVYSLVCVFAFMSSIVVTFIRPRLVRVPLMVVVLLGWAFELPILDLSGAVSNQDLLWVMWQESQTAPDAVLQYAPYIMRDWAFVAILGIVLCASPARRLSVSGIFGLLPIVSGALVAGVTLYTRGGTEVFPIPFGTFTNGAIVLANAWNSPRPVKKPPFWDPALLRGVVTNGGVKIEGEIHPIFNKIVMIMDESVRAEYASTHNATSFLKTTSLIDFGVAISSGNCSHISRTVFRFGMRQSDLRDGWRQGLNRPTIWQFARQAGYKTVHIDASFHNELAPAEKALIDSNITIFENPGYLRDQKLVGKLVDVLKSSEAAFLYVEKYGVHPPYSTKYPPGFNPFPAPVLNEPNHRGFAQAVLGRFLPPVLMVQTPDLEIGHYRNAIAWSVDEFFRKLLPAVNLSKTLIIYTSDHGQSLLPGHFTHCSTTANASLGEAEVPILATTSMPEFKRRLENAAANSFGHYSHFEIFPTLLIALGYDPGWVRRVYGPSLMDPPSADRKFMIGSPEFQHKMIAVDRNVANGCGIAGSHQSCSGYPPSVE